MGGNDQMNSLEEKLKWSLLDVTHEPRDTEERRKDGWGGGRTWQRA